MQHQYLIVAENITYKHNKLSCINIFDHFVSVQLPAEFLFDLSVICGPGWDVGEYNLNIKAKTSDTDLTPIGDIQVNIPQNNFVYNAIAQNLKIVLGQHIKEITFLVFRNDELIIERTYPVNSLLVPVRQPEASSQEKVS